LQTLKCLFSKIQGSERIPWGIGKIVGDDSVTANALPSSAESDTKAHFSSILNNSSSQISVPNPSAVVSDAVAKQSISAASGSSSYIVSWTLVIAGSFISSLY
jgi:hypothetical protein